MASEDEISDAYEDNLEKETDKHLVSQLLKLIDVKLGDIGDSKLCGYERTQLIAMIQNIDYTGKLDCGFEDVRKEITG